MSEMEEFMIMLSSLGVSYHLYIDKQYIHSQALNAEAVKILNIGGVLDFAFDNKGKCVGINTNGINSFIKRKNKRIKK